jgi:hypothetical protein
LNQTDHVIIDAKKKGVVEDVRTMWGLNCDSDNFLVKTIIKQKLISTQINVAKQTKWNQNNLQNPAKLKQYTTVAKFMKRKEQKLTESVEIKRETG